MKNFSAGVVGLGVGLFHLNYFLKNKKCKFVGVCDFDKKKLRKLKKCKKVRFYSSFEEMVVDPNIKIISISSYDNFHAHQILESIRNNKMIFVEKPMCLNFREYLKIKRALEKNKKIKISSNLLLRNSPQFKLLKKKISNKSIGEVYSIFGEYNFGRLKKITNGWRGKLPFYSVMHGGGIHLIDLAIYLTGFVPKKVIGTGNMISSKKTQFKYFDFVSALVEFENSVILNITSNYGSVTPHHHIFKVFGTNASFIQEFKNVSYFYSRDPKKKPRIFSKKYQNIQKDAILDTFVKYVLTNSRPLVTKRDVLTSMATSLAIQKSLITKKWEKVVI